MIDGVLHPAFPLLLGAFLVGLTRGHLRSAVLFMAPVITLWAVWQIPDGVVATAAPTPNATAKAPTRPI